MKKILFTLALLISFTGFSQTPITDANFQTAINTCLSTNPVDGLCSDSEYGAMPDWDVSQVTDMSAAFKNKTDFNGNISSWDVSSVTNMLWMFDYAESFNQPIGDWDVSSVNNMRFMFRVARAFNQDLSSWCVTNISFEPTEFSASGCPLIESNKPVWGTCPSLGIDDQNQLDISIYPNPVIDKLFVQGLSNPTKISVYNILGKLVFSKTTSSEINVDNLQSGIYILKIVDNQKEIVRRFIKN